MSTMYELTQDYKTVQDMLYTGADEQTVMDTLESIAGEIEEKADGYGKIIRNIETDIAGLKDEEKRLISRRRSLSFAARRADAWVRQKSKRRCSAFISKRIRRR